MLAAAYQDTLQKVEELRTQNVAAANTNTELQNEYYRLKDEYSEIVKFLSNAKEQQRSVILNAAKNEDNFFSFELSNKEITLIKTIAEIASLYPELTKDLATIE